LPELLRPKEADMRIRLASFVAFIMLYGSATVHAAAGPIYYLALGDSLAIGTQPNPAGMDGPTTYGYVDDIYAQLSRSIPGLIAEKLGCSDETALSMIKGGVCSYSPAVSQLEAAISFLETHQVALITLDIGANDLDQCISQSGINTACVERGLASVGSNLPWILNRLRAAAGPHTPIFAMNYYDPFLAAWTLPGNGRALALESLEVTTGFNALLEAVYASFRVPVADVAQAFRIYNFALVPAGDIPLPLNVFLTGVYTWMAVPAPVGPNVHPTMQGYAVIAQAFLSKIGTL
jgi:lysophospholipase L1-like esterase